MFVSGNVVASITVDVIFLAVVIDFFNVYLAVDVTTADVVFFATAIVIVVTVALALITSLFLFVSGDVVASITVDAIFLAVVIDFFNVYLAVDVTTADVVFFATAIAIVVTVVVALIAINAVSLVVITVIFVVVFAPTIRIDVLYHTVIIVTIVDFFVNIIFTDIFVVVFIGSGIPQFRWC